ncbi:MAG: ACP S-malonyltransferase [Chloroflexota bacterium]
MTPRAVLACPGRGSYAAASLRSLPGDHPWVIRAEQLRAEYGLEPLLDLDRAERFDFSRHLQPIHASPLIFLVSMLDAEAAVADYQITAVIGNSLGWYTALAVAGALPFEDAFRLVQEMAILQQEPLPSGGPGGQVIYPLADAAWRPDPQLHAAVAAALAEPAINGDGHVHESIDLGAYAVLAGDEAGVARLLGRLAPVRVGERIFPLRLSQHGPYHTPLVAHVAEVARERLGDLEWRAPSATLIDGRGARWTPWSTDPDALRDYTLIEQVTTPFRFAVSVRVALREEAPELLVLPGPGNSLGGICGQLVVAEGYRGIRSREDFEAVQRSAAPVVLSMHR